MSALDAVKYSNKTASTLIKNAPGTFYGVIVNSHTNGTLRFGDGLTTTTAGDKATATLTSDATNVADGATVTAGTVVYRFKDTMALAYDVQIGVDAATSLDNLKAAINASGTPGTEYFAGTLINPDVDATTNTDTTQVVAAKAVGTAGNLIAVAETSTHLTWGVGVTTLSGGAAAAPLILNTITFAAGAGFYQIPVGISFNNGLYATVGGTIDYTVLYS